MANTTNFGWETPDDTDLVKDGAAAMRTLGNSIDASFLDLKGGTTDQVLAKNSNTDLDYKWVPLAAGANWTLLNAGGTLLTGAQTITVSGISNRDKIMILLDDASSASASSLIAIRLNADTGGNYLTFGNQTNATSTYRTDNILVANSDLTNTGIPIGIMSNGAPSAVSGFLMLSGCNASGLKQFNGSGTGNLSTGTSDQSSFNIGGFYNSASTISSVSAFSSTGNFDAGRIYVYTSA